MGASEVGLVAAWCSCFVLAAGLSLIEVAVVRVRRTRVAVATESGDDRARRLLALIDDLPVTLNAILLLALLMQVTTATIGGVLAERWFGNLGITVATIVTTLVLFLYAEAIPKTVAIRSPYQVARHATPILGPLVTALRPVVAALVWLADRQTPGTGAQLSAFSEGELRALARESADAGVIEIGDAELVDRSFEFGDRRVVDVMVPRADIVYARAEQTVADAMALATGAGHRRLPVAAAGIDTVTGMARLGDIAAAASRSPHDPVASVARSVLRCRPEQRIAALMERMQTTECWMAIVVGADGRTLGLATIEDLVAELVGEIAESET